jgi:hypothetical protein
MTMGKDDFAAEPEVARQTRAEELRDQYHDRRGWITPNGLQITSDPEKLLTIIKALEKDLKDKSDERGDAYETHMQAQRDYRAAQEAESRARDALDIHKLALAEAIRIPK